MSPEAAWKATLGELELQMTKATFNTWLRDARFVACEEGNEYVIGVRNDYARDWLQNRLQDTILRTLRAVVGGEVTVRFVAGVDEPARLPAATKNGRWLNGASKGAAGEAAAATSHHNSPLNSYYTFATFVVGHSNRLAHAAALAVAERPGETYNPLFIYGGVGLGKTHLLHAIGHKGRQSGRAVCYVSSETFTNDLIQSIRNQKTAEFREKYRTPDVLLIDDIQFIAGKESTQEELFHTFNDLHSRDKQVVLSSDRPPKAMVTLEERLQSRFEWGLMADIQMPDVETRMAILQTKAEEWGMPVPRSVIEIIAHTVRNNIRELEGALNKVIAYSRLTGQPVDAELLNVALADLIRRPEKVHVEQVVTAVCSHYQLTRDDLCSSSRNRSVAFPRQIAMYLARTETDASFPQIGLTLGSRDHTTILHGYEKIAGLLETDAAVRREVLQIKASLYS